MNQDSFDHAADAPQLSITGKTVQQYIDERPIWSDGTPASFTPMTTMQWRIWWLATAGKFSRVWWCS